MTVEWATQVGLGDYAEDIGYYDNDVDTWRTPICPNNSVQSWHFDRNELSGIDSRDVHSQECLNKAIALWKKADLYKAKAKESFWLRTTYLNKDEYSRRQAIIWLGRGLHPLQDKYAHMDWGTDDFGWIGITKPHKDCNGNNTFDDPDYDLTSTYTPVPGNTRYLNTEHSTKAYLREFIRATGLNLGGY